MVRDGTDDLGGENAPLAVFEFLTAEKLGSVGRCLRLACENKNKGILSADIG